MRFRNILAALVVTVFAATAYEGTSMAREKETISFEDEAVWYVVQIGNNRADPDPFRCLLEPMNLREFERAQNQEARLQVRNLSERSPEQLDQAAVDGAIAFRDKIVAERTRQVEGYGLTDRRTGLRRVPANGVALVETIYDSNDPEELVALEDLYAAIRNRSKLAEGLYPLSSSVSASSSPAATTPSTDGAAPVAAAEKKHRASKKQKLSVAPGAAATKTTRTSHSPGRPS